MTKDIVPQGFTLGLALVDFLPVLFFGGTGIILGMIFKSPLIIIAALVTFLSGFLKVLWKIIVVIKSKNVWPLFIQMRIVMPVSMIAMVIGIILTAFDSANDQVWNNFLSMPQLIFFILGIIGMCLMGYFGAKLDSSDPKANWIEQITNSIAQLFMLIGVLIVLLLKYN